MYRHLHPSSLAAAAIAAGRTLARRVMAIDTESAAIVLGWTAFVVIAWTQLQGAAA